MNIQNTYLVATLSDGSMYKIPVVVILNKMKRTIANQMGITLHEAYLTMPTHDIQDKEIIEFAQTLDYHHVMKDAIKLSRKPAISFKPAWPNAVLQVLTQTQIDNLKIEMEVSHE